MPHLKRDGIMWPVLACAQESFFVSKGARPVAAASKFDPFAKKASSSSTARRAASDRLQPAAAVKQIKRRSERRSEEEQ